VIAPDGSPVEVFRALPPGPGPSYVHDAVVAGGSILDLGCGAGRLAHPLARMGHRVVGVDVSEEMLSCVTVPRVCADVRRLALNDRFDAVVLASYFVNEPDAPAYLAACRSLVKSDGRVIVQRYSPSWARDGVADTTTEGDVTVAVHDFSLSSSSFDAVVTYEIGGQTWDQPIAAVIVDDISPLAEAAGLRLDRWLDEYETWASLSVADRPS
jgi:SAM-dependent methyltransferase